MFKLPGINKNYFLGVDFGTSSIKIVELEYKKGSTYLSNYGWVDLPSKNKPAGDLTIPSDTNADQELTKLLKKLISKMDLKSNSAYISMGAYRGLSALINVEDTGDGDLNEIIKTEASKHIPVSLDEIYLSSDIISRTAIEVKVPENEKEKARSNFFNKKERGKVEVLLVAAPKEDVHKYEKIIEEAGLKVASFELDIFSIVRSLVGDDLGSFLIVDIGAKITNIIFISKGIIRTNRNINIGGDEITKSIASNLNVSWSRAEDFKKKNDYLKGEGRPIIAPILNVIAKEAKRVIELNSTSASEKNILDNIILTGGGSNVAGMKELFAEMFGNMVSLGNPWNRVLIENDIIKEKSANISSKLSVATGLALKGMNNYKRK